LKYNTRKNLFQGEKMKISNLAVVFAAGLLLGGCGAPIFLPKAAKRGGSRYYRVRAQIFDCGEKYEGR